MASALAHQIEPLTPEAVDAMRDGPHLYELVDGQLVERTMSIAAGRVVTRSCFLLHSWLDDNPIADVIDAETSFACFPRDARQVRRADVAVIRIERITEDVLTGVVRIPPDLVVEVVSPNDVMTDVLRKVDDWRSAGVKIVWVIDPMSRRALSFSSGGDRIVGEAGTLDGGDALPGFSRPLADFLKVRGPAVVPPNLD